MVFNKKLFSTILIATTTASCLYGVFAKTNVSANTKSTKHASSSKKQKKPTPKPTQAAESLTVSALTSDDSSVTLVWHKPTNYSNVASYNIYMNGKLIGNTNNNSASASKPFIDNFYKDSSNSSAVKVSSHNYVVTNLTPSTSYNFSVSAIDNNGNTLYTSNTLTSSTTAAPKVYDITKYGAVGDGTTIDTKAIQAAIDACTPGDEVLIPAGKTFKSGSLWLKPNMIFKVNGKILGSENPSDYVDANHPVASGKKSNALINAKGTKGDPKSANLKIVGSGSIDGNGWKQTAPEASTGFPNSLDSSISTVKQNGILAANQFNLGKSQGLSDVNAYATRSNLVSISNITNLYFGDGLSFLNPSQQTIGVSNCNNTILNGALVKTFNCNNADGIDFDSQGLTVVNSVFDTGDDDVNFTAGKGLQAEQTRTPVTNVWIFNNYFGRGHGSVVAGSNTAAWIEEVLAEDNVLNGTGSGLRCKTGKGTGGGAKDITYRDSALKNITDGEGKPFIFTSQYTNATATGSFTPAPDLPQFKDINVSNCSVDCSKNYAIFVSGLPGACHTNINFTNVSFKNTPGASIDYMSNSTFQNVTFDKSITNPWQITNSTGLTFK